MKFKKYIKGNADNERVVNILPPKISTSKLITSIADRKVYTAVLLVCLCIPICGFSIIHKYVFPVNYTDETEMQMMSVPVAAATNEMSTITIPAGTVKANPFLPYKEIKHSVVHDIPNTTLLEPPATIEGDSDAIRVMDTIVSGILYDKYSPSAIINIAGVDYLVKKGDVVNNYKVLNIMKNTVTVKLGANVYEAGIGEVLTTGSMNNNTISNLNTKFGGRK